MWENHKKTWHQLVCYYNKTKKKYMNKNSGNINEKESMVHMLELGSRHYILTSQKLNKLDILQLFLDP